ncbi:MAG: helix-turn-helix transcriptional regulator [Bergeyella sp.]
MEVEEKETLRKFGLHLKKIRQEKRITQEKLAFSIGVEISQISRIERGIINTSVINLYKIASALEISIKDLFPEE